MTPKQPQPENPLDVTYRVLHELINNPSKALRKLGFILRNKAALFSIDRIVQLLRLLVH